MIGINHRKIFTPEVNSELKLLHNPKEVKGFLQNEFKYFSNLYSIIYKYSESPLMGLCMFITTELNEMDSQFLLILAACTLNDPHEKDKIKLISYNVDRLFSLLQLQRSYDSNDFNVAIYKISSEIRDKSIDEIRPVLISTCLNYSLRLEVFRQQTVIHMVYLKTQVLN